MSNAQLYLIMLVPTIGILTSVGLHLCLVGRVDRLADTVGTLGERMAKVEVRFTNVEDSMTRLEETVSRIHV